MVQHDPGGVGIETRAMVPAGLTETDLVRIYEEMVLARSLDERMWLLNRGGQAPFVISGQGHEAAQIGAGFALRPGTDILLPYYRDLALSLHFGLTPADLLLSLLAKHGDPTSQARQMPGHYGSRRLGIISGSSPVATHLPHAAGVGLAIKLRGEDAVAMACFGEGGSSTGDFHEALNFAAIHRLPVLFLCQNNGFAISVPQTKQMAVPHVADRASAYGIPGVTIDGTDPIAVYTAVKEAADRARAGEGPTLLEARVPRLTAHSSDDDARTYRTAEEIEADRAKDPIPKFRNRLREAGILTDELEAEIQARVKAEINAATEIAEQAPYPDPATLLDHVYAS